MRAAFLCPFPIWLLPVVFILSACSSADTSTCQTFNDTVNRNLAAAAISAYEGEVNDKTAIQQGARMAQIGNHLQTIHNHLLLMGQHQCKARTRPVDPTAYAADAQNCYMSNLAISVAKIQEKSADERAAAKQKADAACDFNNWQQR